MAGKRALTPEEQQRLLTHLEARGRYRERLFAFIALMTGFRAQEILSLQVKHFTSGGAIGRDVAVPRRSMKFGRSVRASSVSGRRVPIHAVLRAALGDYWPARMAEPLNPESFLFPNRYGQPITVVHAWRLFTASCREVGIRERVGLHSMRKAFAQAVHAASGGDLFRTQQLLSHKSPLTTVKYLHVSEAELDSLVLGLEYPVSAQASPAAAASR